MKFCAALALTIVTARLTLFAADQPRPAFEVASVKPIDKELMSRDHEGMQLTRSLFVDRTELIQYIVRAYIPHGGGPCTLKTAVGQDCPLIAVPLPKWVTTDRWEIQAKLPANTPDYTEYQRHKDNTPELNLMLQALLEERFQMRVHREIREMPVYALTVGKGGPKLTASTPASQNLTVGDGSAHEVHGMTGRRRVPVAEGFRSRLTFQASTMQDAAEDLATFFERPILDRTGLSGQYDFTIEYEEDPAESGPVANPSMSGRGGAFVNMFTGLSASVLNVSLQDLGLKLESIKAPVEVLIVDRVERPTQN